MALFRKTVKYISVMDVYVEAETPEEAEELFEDGSIQEEHEVDFYLYDYDASPNAWDLEE